MARKFTQIPLPKELADELKVWKMAFSNSCGHPVSYAEMFRGMLDSLEDTQPDVFEEFDRLVMKHPELKGLVLGKEVGDED